MTLLTNILRTKCGELIFWAHFYAIVISFASGTRFLSSTPLWLRHRMLTRRHALPTRLSFFDILFGYLSLFFSCHRDLLWSIELNEKQEHPFLKKLTKGGSLCYTSHVFDKCPYCCRSIPVYEMVA